MVSASMRVRPTTTKCSQPMGTGICCGNRPQKHVHVRAATRQWHAHAQKSSSKEGAVSIPSSYRSFCANRSPSIRIAPRVPSQLIWSRRRLVHRIGSTGPANPAHGCQTLFKCYPPAIPGTTMLKIVIGAPRTILRLSRFFDADDSCESAHD